MALSLDSLVLLTLLIFSHKLQKLTKILSLHPSEISQIKTELENYDKALGEKSRVTFESDLSMSVVEFLSCFECQVD